MKEKKHTINTLRILLLLLVVLISLRVQSQETKGFAYYDSLTYSLYTSGSWKELNAAGNEALDSGLDYYYLRARIAIALYNLRNYRAAVSQFEKAMEFNSNDPFVLQYLYYAYLEAGRSPDAVMLTSEHKQIIPTVPGVTGKFVKSIYTEGGITPDASPVLSASELLGTEGIYGESDVYKEQMYYHAGLNLQFLPAMSVYAGVSVLDLNKQHRFIFPFYNTQGHSSIKDTAINYQFRQSEFYFSASFLGRTGITITPAFHSLSGNPTLTYSTALGNSYNISEYKYRYNHYVFSLSGTKELGNFTLGLNGSYANLASTGSQKQVGTSLTWYPFGNLDLYATTSITGLMLEKTNKLIIDGSIGGKILPKVWLEGTYTGGGLSYYNEKNAFVAYNLSETINYRIGANLIYTLAPHLDLSLMYRFYERENEFLNAVINKDNGEIEIVSNKNKYQNYSFFGGLKWKF